MPDWRLVCRVGYDRIVEKHISNYLEIYHRFKSKIESKYGLSIYSKEITEKKAITEKKNHSHYLSMSVGENS